MPSKCKNGSQTCTQLPSEELALMMLCLIFSSAPCPSVWGSIAELICNLVISILQSNKLIPFPFLLWPSITSHQWKPFPTKSPLALEETSLSTSDIGHDIWQDILAIIANRHDLLNASHQCEYRQTVEYVITDRLILNLSHQLRFNKIQRPQQIRHVIYGIPTLDKRSNARWTKYFENPM